MWNIVNQAICCANFSHPHTVHYFFVFIRHLWCAYLFILFLVLFAIPCWIKMINTEGTAAVSRLRTDVALLTAVLWDDVYVYVSVCVCVCVVGRYVGWWSAWHWLQRPSSQLPSSMSSLRSQLFVLLMTGHCQSVDWQLDVIILCVSK